MEFTRYCNLHCFRIKLESGFCGGRKSGVPREKKNPRNKAKNQQRTRTIYDVTSEIQTRATLVGKKCYHHCTIPAFLESLIS